jgi:hypothetical protein
LGEQVYLASEKARLKGGLEKKLSEADRLTVWDALDEEAAWMKDHDEESMECSAEEYEQRKQGLMDLLEPILNSAEAEGDSDSEEEEEEEG